MPEIPAISISFILAVLNNFHWNRVWTYPELRNSEPRKRFVKFAIISIAGYLIRTPIFSLLEKPIFGFLEKSSFYIFSISPAIIAHNLTLGIVIIIVLFWNYFANRIWTYKSLSEGDLHEVDLS
jgi:putative flippase GtrA